MAALLVVCAACSGRSGRSTTAVTATCAALAAGGGCGGRTECFTATVDAAVCDPATATFSLASTNPYYPLKVGSVAILEGTEEGAAVRVERRVLADTEVVMGVTAHVLEARELVAGELHEVARDFYVEAADGTVCYFGEAVDFYKDGAVVNHDGSWRAGEGGAKPGIIMPAVPRVGDAYFQEQAPGVALDMGRVTQIDGAETFAGTAYSGVVTVLDSDPLEDGEPCQEERKQYAPGVGEAVDAGKTLTSFTPGT